MIWNNPPKFVPVARAGKKVTPEALAKSNTEHGHQAALFCWAADSLYQYPQLNKLFAIPNGGDRHKLEAINLVAAGTRKGVPDIFLASPVWPAMFVGPLDACKFNTYHGCFIEMKREKYRNHKNGGCSDEQLEWIADLRNAGYYVTVCYNWIEAKNILINYLEGKL